MQKKRKRDHSAVGRERSGLKWILVSGLVIISVATAIFGGVFMMRKAAESSLLPVEGKIEVEAKHLCDASMNHSAWIKEGKAYIAGEPFENADAIKE